MNLKMESAGKTLEQIQKQLSGLPMAKMSDFTPENAALVVIDVVNGFVSEGPLQSLRVAGIVPKIADVMRTFCNKGFPVLVFADTHNENSPEFESYPPHCIAGTSECTVVESLEKIGSYTHIPKNSTNGFLEPRFQAWLNANTNIRSFVVVGDCTDICIDQFAKTLKAYFNMLNEKARVIVPVEAVETFDLDLTNHYAELMNVMAFYGMIGAGIEVVSGIDFDS